MMTCCYVLLPTSRQVHHDTTLTVSGDICVAVLLLLYDELQIHPVSIAPGNLV